MKSHQNRVHSWLKELRVAYHPQDGRAVLDQAASGLLDAFATAGHQLQKQPTSSTDLLLTTAPVGKALNWRDALIFTARRKFGLNRNPTVVTLVHLTRTEFQGLLERLERNLSRDEPDPEDFQFPGLADKAHQVLFEQGRRGGPILALERIIQAQAKSIRVVLVIGDNQPQLAFVFNLVGAHPRIEADEPDRFYQEIMLRLVTALSTDEITNHTPIGDEIPHEVWHSLGTVKSMKEASQRFGEKGFFTKMVRIEDLVNVPAVSDVVSSQYSEGCFATWDPEIRGLIATVTGSARPVQKDRITEEDLAVIAGVREDGEGALVRHVEGKRNDPPSSEAVEMIDMDDPLPQIEIAGQSVPVIRSKLHGHRGVAGFNPQLVEHVRLDLPYYHYPVSCATQAQAEGIKRAFSRSEALQNPEDPRQLVFTVLPGHGVVIAEKWVQGKEPFQVIWEAMDAGDLMIDNHVPQGLHAYVVQGSQSLLREDAELVLEK